MGRPSWGHVPRHCVYCGHVGPRVIVLRGFAHRRCIPRPAQKRSHPRHESPGYKPGMRFRENRPGYVVDTDAIDKRRIPGSGNRRVIELIAFNGRQWSAAVHTEIDGTRLDPPRHIRIAERTLKSHYVQVTP